MAKIQYREVGVNVLRVAIKVAVILFVVVLFMMGFKRAYQLGVNVFTDDAISESGDGVTIDITVIAGESALDVGTTLEKKGIIADGLAFWIQTKVYEVKIAPGTYTVSSEQSSKAILRLMDNENSTGKVTP